MLDNGRASRNQIGFFEHAHDFTDDNRIRIDAAGNQVGCHFLVGRNQRENVDTDGKTCTDGQRMTPPS